jgi:hypothetical protein
MKEDLRVGMTNNVYPRQAQLAPDR